VLHTSGPVDVEFCVGALVETWIVGRLVVGAAAGPGNAGR